MAELVSPRSWTTSILVGEVYEEATVTLREGTLCVEFAAEALDDVALELEDLELEVGVEELAAAYAEKGDVG